MKSFSSIRRLILAAGAAMLTLPASALQDTNGNSLSDVWERHYNDGELFSLANPMHAPEADPDGDGWSNAREAVAGTDPFNGELPQGWVQTEFISHPEADGLFILSWPSQQGKVYRLKVSPDLTSWADFGESIQGTGSNIEIAFDAVHEDYTIPDKLFVRVQIQDEDPDGDSLNSWEEFILGYNPYSHDTDLDGLPDNLDPSPLDNAVIADPDGAGLVGTLADGLIGRWDCEEIVSFGGNVTGFNDLAGGDHPLKCTGSTLGLDPLGIISKGVVFDAETDHLSAPGSLVANRPAFTIATWFRMPKGYINSKPTNVHTTFFVFNNTIDTYPDLQVSVYKPTGGATEQKLVISHYWQGLPQPEWHVLIPPAKRLDDGNWRHLALVKRTGALDLYLDGVLLGTNVVTVTSWTADANAYVCFGKLFPNTVNHGHTFRGSFDRMLFYSRALNSTEVRDLHRQDSDRDGLWDITEIKSRLWRDNNNNGQQEAGEFSYISSPYYWQPPDTDSDGDGASDLIEQAAGTVIGKADTDGDLIPDGYEIEHGLDPLDPSDAALDPDSDGLTNYEEWIYNTDPNNPNSDGGNTEYPDNVNDGNEVNQGSDPNNPRDGGTAPDESEIRTIRLGVGDQSGSESEDYVVHCYRIDKETGEETRVYTFRSGGFGEYDEQDVDIFRKGESYTFQIQWQGSTLESLPASGGSPGEGADFDYTFKIEPEDDDDGILIDSYDPKTGQFRLDEPILDDDANDVTDFRERIQTRRVVLLEAETVIGEPGSEEEIPGDWVLAEAFPKPSVEMTIVSAETVGSDLHIQVQGTVRDPVSKYAINASERPQQLKFLHQGTVLHSVPLGAGVASGVSFNETVVIANAMPVSYILRAETSPNVAGLTGFDQCAVSLTWNEDATAFPALSAPLSIYFSAAPTSGVVDEAKVYVGSGAPPGGANNMTETAADSLAFTGTLTIPATPVAISAPCEFRFSLPKTFSTTTADSIVLDFRYTAPGYPQNVFYGRWLETGPNTRIFRPYGWFFGDVALKVAFTEDLPGSVATELEPATIRLPALPGQGNDPGDFRIVAGNTTYNLFKKDGYWYPKDTLKPGAPKMFLPSSLPVPTRLAAPGYDANTGKLAFKIQLDAETEVDASEIYVVPGAPPPDPGGGGGLGPLGGPPIPMSGGGEPWYPGQPVQLHQLLWAYKLLHADDTFALELLDGFLRGGHQIELGDIWGDLDLDVTLNDIFTDADNIWTIQIEEDWNPVYCARLLFEGLKRASVHAEVYSNYQFDDPFDDILAFKSALNAAVQQTRETAVFATELYLSGFGIINEGLDWILVFNDVSEGRYESLAGALPFVPAGLIKSGGSLIFRKGANEVLGTLDEAGVEALRQVTRETDLRVMGVLMDQHQFSESIRRALSANGGRINPPTDRDGLRKAMIAAAPRPKGKVVAHHDFPWSEKRWFADHGIDVNDPAFGRWVSPMEHSTWHSGAGMGPGGQFHNAWRTFIDGEDALAPYTVAEILDKLAEIRAQFPVTGGP